MVKTIEVKMNDHDEEIIDRLIYALSEVSDLKQISKAF